MDVTTTASMVLVIVGTGPDEVIYHSSNLDRKITKEWAAELHIKPSAIGVNGTNGGVVYGFIPSLRY